jgi:hypothetical protein
MGSVLVSMVLSLGLVVPAQASTAPAVQHPAALQQQAGSTQANALLGPSPDGRAAASTANAPLVDAGLVGSPASASTPKSRAAGPLRRVSGRVVGPDGIPVAGIEVAVLSAPGSAGPHASTRPDGSWEVQVPAGRYMVSFRDPQGRFAGGWYGSAGLTTIGSARWVTVGTKDLSRIDVRLALASHPMARPNMPA